eukprot:7875403-Lingulodinium_polyedra.AAC.1
MDTMSSKRSIRVLQHSHLMTVGCSGAKSMQPPLKPRSAVKGFRSMKHGRRCWWASRSAGLSHLPGPRS